MTHVTTHGVAGRTHALFAALLMIVGGAATATAQPALRTGAADTAGGAVAATRGFTGTPSRVAEDSVTVDGVVVDAQTGAPLPGTTVRVVDLGRQDVTHANGEFHLINLPAGRHTLLFERIGYRREVRQLDTRAGQRIDLRVEMRPSPIELPGLAVTGMVGARLGDEAVRPTLVLSGQDLLRKLDVTLAASLRQEPGLAMTSMGPATGRPVIRGLSGDRVLVLEDGVRVGDMSASSPDHAVASDPLNARRLEVVRGPAALLYGSNAIGGVINVIREEVPTSLPDRTTGTFSAQAQSANRGGAAGGTAESAVGTVALRAEATLRGAGDLRVPDAVLGNTGLRTYDLSAGASTIERWGHAGVAYRYYDNQYGVPGGFVGAHAEGVDVEMRRHALHGNARVRPARGPFGTIDARVNYTNYYHRELEDVGITGTEFGLLTSAAEVIARHDALGPFSEGAVGARAQWQDFAAGGSIGTPPAQEWWAAGFVLQEAALGPLTLQVGGRYDWHRVSPTVSAGGSSIGDVRRRDFGSMSGSAGALLSLGEGFGVGASVARAYRTPSVTELFSEGPHLAAYSFEIGNPDLDAESGIGLDAFVRVEHETVRAEASVFRNAIANYIYYANTGDVTNDGLPIFQAIGQDALLTGFEASAEWSPVQRLAFDGVVSYVRGTNRADDTPLPMVPPLNGRLQARYDRTRYFVGAGWRGAAAQDRLGEFEERTDGHSLFDVLAGYRWTAGGRIHSLSLRLDNVTDTLYREHLSRVKSIMPEAGRSASLTYRLIY